MVTNVTSLLKTVKAVEDEHSRGTRALESSIEAIAQEIRAFDSAESPKQKSEPEDLIRATRPITLATGKAVSAGKSLKQEDIIVAANMGRKAISDMLTTCKVGHSFLSSILYARCPTLNGRTDTSLFSFYHSSKIAFSSIQNTAYHSDKGEVRAKALNSGRDVAMQYRELLQLVMHSLNKPNSDSKQQIGNISRKIAQCVTELAAAAEQLKDDDWVNPEDPTFIAENELMAAARSIENAGKKLSQLKPRREVKGKVSSKPCFTNMFFEKSVCTKSSQKSQPSHDLEKKEVSLLCVKNNHRLLL